MNRWFTTAATQIATLAGQPHAFLVALLILATWALTGPLFAYSDTWQLVVNTVTTIVTFLMVFLIQNSQNRDAAAMQAKLDELIRAVEGARNEFIGIEHLSDRQVEAIRRALEADVAAHPRGHGRAASVERLLQRR